MIAMALSCEPKLLIADEPTTALDVTIQAQILELLNELVVEHDTALVLITHDLGVVAGMCERVAVMYAGTFVETGDAVQLFATHRHPYTQGLLRSVPRLDQARREPLRPIAGSPRDMLEEPRWLPVRATLPAAARRSAPRSGRRSSRSSPAPTTLRLLQPGAGRRRRGARRHVTEALATNGYPDEALVRLEDLKVWFPIKSGVLLDRHVGDVHAVDGVTLEIRRGETLGLVGESGCGKSTVGRAILRLYEPTDGRIVFDGQDVSKLGRERAAAAAAADADGLPGPVRVAQPAPLRSRGSSASRSGARPRAAGAPRRAACASCSRPSACRRTRRRATRTSSRAASASASASPARSRVNPDLIVADEPVSALDVSIQAQIVNLLESLQEEFELTYLFIAHDLAVVRHISDRIAVMYLGALVEVAPRGRPLRAAAPPVHDLAALGRPDPGPGDRAAAQAILLAGDLPSPGEPAERLPLPHALPVRPADALPRRGAAAPRARRAGPPGRLPLGRGHPGGQARAEDRRPRIRGRR